MTANRTTFSVCVPAYNRARHLGPLLDSVLQQDYQDFEIIICEDCSPERQQIRHIARDYGHRYPGRIFLYENEANLGYDGNIRNLIQKATGKYCFFLGNDDLMAQGALAHVSDVIRRNPDTGLVLKSYAWFKGNPSNIQQEVRYFSEEKVFRAGREAITICFRRSGVIAGYVVERDAADSAATSKFDGTLYYQMHVSASVLATRPAVFTPKVLVLCRDGEAPDFGHSASEKEKYTPGRYTPSARVNMVRGALTIVRDLRTSRGIDVVDDVTRDYANYFYPYIKDQLNLPFRQYMRLYRDYAGLGLSRYPMFHFYSLVCYVLGERLFDQLTKIIRSLLGRSPQIGIRGRT